MERTFLCVDLHLRDAFPHLSECPLFWQHELYVGIIHPTDFVIEPFLPLFRTESSPNSSFPSSMTPFWFLSQTSNPCVSLIHSVYSAKPSPSKSKWVWLFVPDFIPLENSITKGSIVHQESGSQSIQLEPSGQPWSPGVLPGVPGFSPFPPSSFWHHVDSAPFPYLSIHDQVCAKPQNCKWRKSLHGLSNVACHGYQSCRAKGCFHIAWQQILPL